MHIKFGLEVSPETETWYSGAFLRFNNIERDILISTMTHDLGRGNATVTKGGVLVVVDYTITLMFSTFYVEQCFYFTLFIVEHSNTMLAYFKDCTVIVVV